MTGKMEGRIQEMLDEMSKNGWEFMSATSLYEAGCIILFFRKEN